MFTSVAVWDIATIATSIQHDSDDVAVRTPIQTANISDSFFWHRLCKLSLPISSFSFDSIERKLKALPNQTEFMADNLFNEIGGSEVVSDIVDDFYDRVVADPSLKKFFEHAPMERIKSMQRQFFGIAIGAPLEYSGRSLAETHKGRGIKRDDITKFTEHLMATLSEIGISDSDANRFISRIAMYADEVLGETTVDG